MILITGGEREREMGGGAADDRRRRGHVLLLPYPSQGHISPMLQFGKRLAHHGVHVTLATTRFILRTTTPDPLGPIALAPISDGFDDRGFGEAGDVALYLDHLASSGSATLSALIESLRDVGSPVDVVVYDGFLPWALDVGERLGVACAAFFTQSCAVNAVYCHVNKGKLVLPAEAAVALPGLPVMEPGDMPSFWKDLQLPGPYPAYFALVLNQFSNLERAPAMLVNTFYELEIQEVTWLKTYWPVKTVGPTVPSSYLDNSMPSDTRYGFNLFAPDTAPCMAWLDAQHPRSVVYVSFGSMVVFNPDETKEIACGLQNTGKSFLWVVRASEASKLPADFLPATAGRGLVVTWSPQLDVLAHAAVGCFVTHCGWNSVTEGLCLGVPMVGMPQWTDQPTNGKYIEDVWKVGVRARADDSGIVRKGEIERCVREVMDGGRAEEMARNVREWREKAKIAVSEGGSSDDNTIEFIEKYCS